MNIFNVTPQELKVAEASMRTAMRKIIIGGNLSSCLTDARSRTPGKQELVAALRSIIRVIDAAQYAGIAINVDDYRRTLAKELIALERLENAVAVFDELLEGEKA